MKFSGIPVAAAAGAAVAALLGTVPAGAGEGPTLSVDPTSGPIGTTVTISGDSCPGGQVRTGVLRPPTDDTGFRWPVVLLDFEAGGDGEWSVDVIIPASAPLPSGESLPVVPSADYQVGGLCSGPEGGQGFQYDNLSFEVTPGGGPTPTTSVPSTPTTGPPTTPTPPAPATPIVDDPPFTG